MRKKQNINNTCTLLLLMGGLSLIILDLINRKSVNFQETFQFTVGKCQHFEMFRCSPEKTQRLAGWEALCTTVGFYCSYLQKNFLTEPKIALLC